MPTPAHMLFSPVLDNSSPRPQSSAYPDMSSASSQVRSYLSTGRIPRSPDLEGQGLKARSPRSSNVSQFEPTLSVPEYESYPSAYSRPAKRNTHASTSPLPAKIGEPSTPRNVPSRPLPRTRTPIPKAVIRLVASVVALITLAVILTRAPAGQLLEIGALGSANHEGAVWDRGYKPPQLRSEDMAGRAHAARSTRISFVPHPIPSSHELLALQSYLLQSSHNALPAHIDTSQPLDGHVILAISPSKFGRPGSKMELAWLKELEKEREEEIVIWIPTGTGIEVEDMYEILATYHPDTISPAYIVMEGRSDEDALGQILDRLGLRMEGKPMMMIGNKPILGGKKELAKMAEDGTLEKELKRIRWLDEAKVKQMKLALSQGKKIDPVRKAGSKPRIMNAGFKH